MHRRVSWIELSFGLFFAAGVLLILFVAPREALLENGMRLPHMGDIFRTLELFAGTRGARLLTAAPFALLSWVSLRRAFKVTPK